MDIMQLAVQLFKNQLDQDRDGQLEVAEIASALMNLMGGSQNQAQAGGLSGLAAMLSGMQSSKDSGLASLAASWLGTGQNIQPSGAQITQMFGQDKIAAFAQQLGLSPEQAIKGLQATVPEVVDKASPNGQLDMGSLLNAVGGIQGAINLAGKLFGR
ncbi:MAG: YidB family protein [Thiothrix sp.]